MAQNVVGKVSDIGVLVSNNYAWLKFIGTVSGTYGGGNPNGAGTFGLDLSEAGAQQLFRVIMAGQMQGLPVHVLGSTAYLLDAWEKISQAWLEPAP